MKAPIAAFLVATLLAGCAQAVYDQRAVPTALSSLQLNDDRCLSMAASFHSMTELVDCYLAGRASFTQAIKLNQPILFQNMVDRSRLLAAEFDAGNLRLEDFAQRFAAVNMDFVNAIVATANVQQADALRRARIIQGVARGLQGYAQGRAAATANSFNCTANRVGRSLLIPAGR